MAKLQIAMSETELNNIYKVLIKASARFQLQEGKNFNYRTTIIKIIEEWAKTHEASESNDKKKK